MTKSHLEELLERARSRPMTFRERREQGISFIVGNEAAEGRPLHRGTVTVALPRSSEEPRNTRASAAVLGIPTVPFDVDGPLRQFRAVEALVERQNAGERVAITPELIRELHAAAGDAGSAVFGAFRQAEVMVSGSEFRPIAPSEVPQAMAALCDHLNAHWDNGDSISLGAYALWRLNWIHPFLDGNGRTARALCYLVLNLKFGGMLPGSPTLIEQLGDRRSEYYAALAAADLTFAARGQPNLEPMRQLLSEMLLRQLQSLPALSAGDETKLVDIFTRRIEPLDPELCELIYGSIRVAHRAWAIADYLIVHVGSPETLRAAEALFEEYGRPFPGMLAAPGQSATITLSARQRGAIVRPRHFKAITGAALWLEPNGAVVVERPTVSISDDEAKPIQWALDGAFYILRRGDELTELWAFDVLDLMVSRHIHEAH